LKETLEIFRESQALLEGHFILTSGKHSDKYIQCAKVLQYPWHAEELAGRLRDKIKDEVSLVIGPAMGGVVLAQEVARCLKVPAIFSEREQGKMAIRRGFEITPGAKVLVVEDVITTGGSVQEVVDLVKREGGIPVAVAVLVNRSGGKATFSVPLHELLAIDAQTFDPKECHLCQQGTKAVKPGSRNLPGK